MRKTLEQVIRDNAEEFGVISSEFIVRVQNDTNEGLEVYIRPNNRNGDTHDFIIKNNSIVDNPYVSYPEDKDYPNPKQRQ